MCPHVPGLNAAAYLTDTALPITIILLQYSEFIFLTEYLETKEQCLLKLVSVLANRRLHTNGKHIKRPCLTCIVINLLITESNPDCINDKDLYRISNLIN